VFVRILRQSNDIIDGLSLKNYRVGQCYDLAPNLANYLVTRGLATFEMRKHNRSERPRTTDRRKNRHPY
jgi:hypothetical protein